WTGSHDTAAVAVSTDRGASWDLVHVPDSTGCVLTLRDDGAWMLPLFLCKTSPGARWTGSHDTAAVAVSTDRGASWDLVHVPDSTGCV
ncbi:glycosyl hydrolase, partial [Amaricoccus sp. HAR-UPW-R2A-40]